MAHRIFHDQYYTPGSLIPLFYCNTRVMNQP
jgi:hypothetical protein